MEMASALDDLSTRLEVLQSLTIAIVFELIYYTNGHSRVFLAFDNLFYVYLMRGLQKYAKKKKITSEFGKF